MITVKLYKAVFWYWLILIHILKAIPGFFNRVIIYYFLRTDCWPAAEIKKLILTYF